MHRRTAIRAVAGGLFLAFAALQGCGGAGTQSPAGEAAGRVGTGEDFDAASAGAVAGRVIWTGELPSVLPLVDRPGLRASGFADEQPHWPNPNAPAIHPATGAVRGAVVFLRGIDPHRGRPWDLPAVSVIQRGRQLRVRQGEVEGTVGFVRRGDSLTMISEDTEPYSLHAGGAAFFTLAFPDPHKPRQRPLRDRGVVELSSGAGAFWMRGYLFVDDHPYFTQTDAEGCYRLPQVPPGRYEVVCWLPDWREEHHERDPETGLVTRVYFRPPLQWASSVEVAGCKDSAVNFEPAAP